MSGHSKWSTIKHAKGINDARRGKLFTKLTKEIIVAVKDGGPDPDANFKLRMAVQRAKDQNLPGDTIDRAIKRASGEGSDGAQMVEATYEGYGPGGIGILVEVLTDKTLFSRYGDRQKFPVKGANGGGEGRPGRFVLNPDGEARPLKSKGVDELRRGDIVRIVTPGGGGYGPPEKRPVAAVADDLHNGKISEGHVRDAYGAEMLDRVRAYMAGGVAAE